MARLKIADLEVARRTDPFEIELSDGTVLVFKDPKSIPAEALLNFDITKPAVVMRAALGAEAFDAFFHSPEVDGYVLEAVLTRYVAHYGLQSSGEAGASPA
jgi:hypothetical protein